MDALTRFDRYTPSPGDSATTELQRDAANAVRGKNQAQLRGAAEQFEAVFVTQMLSHMFDGLQPDPNFGGGHAEEIFRSLLLDEYGKSIAKNGGIGIADAVQKQLIQMQEHANG